MTRDEALAIGRRVQEHGYGWTHAALTDRISDELLKAFDAGAEAVEKELEPQIKMLETMLREDR